MVMVSITFASLNPRLQAHLRPAGFPHAHPRISNILGHGSKLMAISLLVIWLVPWPKPRLGHGLRFGPCLGIGQGTSQIAKGQRLMAKLEAMAQDIRYPWVRVGEACGLGVAS